MQYQIVNMFSFHPGSSPLSECERFILFYTSNHDAPLIRREVCDALGHGPLFGMAQAISL